MKENKNKKIKYLLLILTTIFVGASNVLAASLNTSYVQCGQSSFPAPLASMIRIVILLLQILVPIGIIVMGSIDFLKATIAADPDKMKKNQKQFVTRLVAGALTFFVFVIIKFAVSVAGGTGEDSSENFMSCVDCLINDSGSCSTVSESPFND